LLRRAFRKPPPALELALAIALADRPFARKRNDARDSQFGRFLDDKIHLGRLGNALRERYRKRRRVRRSDFGHEARAYARPVDLKHGAERATARIDDLDRVARRSPQDDEQFAGILSGQVHDVAPAE
jgi:hypothetical protein